MNLYPEHDRLKSVAPFYQVIAEFLEWADHRGWALCSYSGEKDVYEQVYRSRQEILAEYFEVNLKRIDDEKRAMLEAHRRVLPPDR